MELTTLVSPEEATERLAEYETQVRTERTAEDEAIAAGYRAAKRGMPVISLPEVIRAGGFFDKSHRPKLAIARADATEVRVDQADRDIVWSTDTWSRDPWWNGRPQQRTRLVGHDHVRVHGVRGDYFSSGQTIVPPIPPRFRPRLRRLHGFHVLWEVEKWDPTPPVDPALLRHIRGDLWAVVATWDLTELERAVLAQRTS